MRTWMKDEWTKCYENSFVQTTLLSPILRYLLFTACVIYHLVIRLKVNLELIWNINSNIWLLHY